jgi:hypothetical protein
MLRQVSKSVQGDGFVMLGQVSKKRASREGTASAPRARTGVQSVKRGLRLRAQTVSKASKGTASAPCSTGVQRASKGTATSGDGRATLPRLCVLVGCQRTLKDLASSIFACSGKNLIKHFKREDSRHPSYYVLSPIKQLSNPCPLRSQNFKLAVLHLKQFSLQNILDNSQNF